MFIHFFIFFHCPRLHHPHLPRPDRGRLSGKYQAGPTVAAVLRVRQVPGYKTEDVNPQRALARDDVS